MDSFEALCQWAKAHARQHMTDVELPPEIDDNCIHVNSSGCLTGYCSSGSDPMGADLTDQCVAVEWHPDPEDPEECGELVEDASGGAAGWLLWRSDCPTATWAAKWQPLASA